MNARDRAAAHQDLLAFVHRLSADTITRFESARNQAEADTTFAEMRRYKAWLDFLTEPIV
jgi:hypothetical protein